MATCLTQQISGAEDSAQVTCRSGPAMLAAARHPASLVGLGSESAQYACDSPQLHSSGANNEDAHHVTSSSRSHSAAPPPPPMDQSRCSGQAQAVQSPGTAAEQQQEQQQQEQQQEQQQQEQQSPTASPACTAAGAPLSPPLTWDGARATTPLPRLEPLSPPSPREGAAVAAEYDAYLARFAAGDTIAQRWHRLAAAGRLEALKDEWEDAQHDLMLSRLQAGLGISGRGTRRQRDEEEEPHDGDAPRQVRARRAPAMLGDFQLEGPGTSTTTAPCSRETTPGHSHGGAGGISGGLMDGGGQTHRRGASVHQHAHAHAHGQQPGVVAADSDDDNDGPGCSAPATAAAIQHRQAGVEHGAAAPALRGGAARGRRGGGGVGSRGGRGGSRGGGRCAGAVPQPQAVHGHHHMVVTAPQQHALGAPQQHALGAPQQHALGVPGDAAWLQWAVNMMRTPAGAQAVQQMALAAAQALGGTGCGGGGSLAQHLAAAAPGMHSQHR